MILSELTTELLWRFWRGETDEEENIRVESLLSDHQEIADEYQRLIKTWQYSKYAGKWEHICMERAWQKIENRCETKRTGNWSYYAAASAILVIGLAVAFFYQSYERSDRAYEVAKVLPGSPKAQLILATGEKIDLSHPMAEKITDQGVIIDRDTAFLKYEAGQSDQVTQGGFNELIIPRGGEYKIELADGTKIYLNAESRLRYPVTFSDTYRKVWLEGEAYFEVAADSLHPFIVETAQLDVQVLGTGFNVMAYGQEERAEVTLVHGKVGVKTAGGKTLLNPNEQLVFHYPEKSQRVREVKVDTYVSWKEGVLEFDGMPLSELVGKLSRWYDVEFLFGSEEIKQLKFSGAFKKYNDIQYVLDLICETTDVQFALNGRTVMINHK